MSFLLRASPSLRLSSGAVTVCSPRSQLVRVANYCTQHESEANPECQHLQHFHSRIPRLAFDAEVCKDTTT